MAVKLLVADDHELIRAGLKSLLAGTDIKVTGEAENGEEVQRLLLKGKFDLVLLDVRMPQIDGLTVLSRIKANYPELPVLIFSAFDNSTTIARAVALRASGFLLKSESRARIIEAIQRAAKGEAIWSRRELRRVTGTLASGRANPDLEVSLTPRENEILAQLTEGLTNKEIAQELRISYETVKEHVQHVLRKIGVTDRTQAAVWAVRQVMRD